MPIGVLLLVGVGVLIFFGVAQRVLDRLHLTDKAAIVFVLAMIVGSFIPAIPITRTPKIALNIGGGLVPLILAVYVLVRAGSAKEWIRAIIASVVTGIAIFLVATYLFPNAGHSSTQIIDSQYVFPIIGGVVAYVAGRSRRSAFVAGVLGFFIYDLISHYRTFVWGQPTTFYIGGAGAMDTMVISGIIAVLIAEIIGETRERLGGGPYDDEDRPHGLRNKEYANALGAHPDERRKRFEVKKGGKKDGQK